MKIHPDTQTKTYGSEADAGMFPSMPITVPQGLQDTATHELLAMLELMYLVATADGFFSISERREFLASLESLSEGRLGSTELTQLMNTWTKRGPGDSLDARLEELANALPDITSRRIAYGLALQIAESDGEYLRSEAAMMDRIASAFGLPRTESEEIAQSVRMSRRPVPS